MPAIDAVPVAPSNAEQLRAWNGDEGAYAVPSRSGLTMSSSSRPMRRSTRSMAELSTS